MLSRKQTLLLIFLYILTYNTSSMKVKQAGVSDHSEDLKLVLIQKCCPSDMYLDEWHDCVDSEDAVLNTFKELFEAGKKHKSEYEVVQTNRCKENMK